MSLVGAGLIQIISETLSLSEADLRFMVLVREVAETLGLTEQDLRAMSITRVLSENESVQEVVIRLRSLLRTQSEAMQLAETDSWIRGFLKIVNEGIELVEGVVRKVAAAITGALKEWRRFVPRSRSMGGDRGYDATGRNYTKNDRDHSN
jgi:predicted NUDIX family phosphoesterase